ncbi:MAG: hypothetical protein ACI8ZM_005687 [Crocinitomix sp.]|jgi:hypothetical protein
MSLVGTYHSSEVNSTFIVTEANDANGQGKGTIEISGITIPVTIHYHFENNVGPQTDLWFAGNKDNPNEYVGGAGTTSNQNYDVIKIAGGYPDGTDVLAFEGNYKRQ